MIIKILQLLWNSCLIGILTSARNQSLNQSSPASSHFHLPGIFLSPSACVNSCKIFTETSRIYSLEFSFFTFHLCKKVFCILFCYAGQGRGIFQWKYSSFCLASSQVEVLEIISHFHEHFQWNFNRHRFDLCLHDSLALSPFLFLSLALSLGQ